MNTETNYTELITRINSSSPKNIFTDWRKIAIELLKGRKIIAKPLNYQASIETYLVVEVDALANIISLQYMDNPPKWYGIDSLYIYSVVE
jgi:hypothetical protein